MRQLLSLLVSVALWTGCSAADDTGTASNAPGTGGVGGTAGIGGTGGAVACTNLCTTGTSECFGNAVRTCAVQGTGCADWNAPVACADGQTCQTGQCTAGCTNLCTPGAYQCAGIQIQQCVTDAAGCAAWGPSADCPAGQTCNGAACQTSCTNICTDGSSECVDTLQVHTCALQLNGCTDWNPATLCPTAQACVGEACVGACSDTCTAGTTQCSGDQVQSCAVQGSGCTDWNLAEDCPLGQTCQGTACATAGTGGSGGSTGGSGGSTGGSGGSTGGSGGTTTDALADCRGVVAVRSGSGNYVSWRLKATDPANIAFNVYRDATLLNTQPITDSTNYLDSGAAQGSSYHVAPVIGGVEQGSSETVAASPNNYISIPLNNGGTTQAGRLVGVGDLDGDCRYDFVVKRSDGDRDVTQTDPYPDETIKLQAYSGTGEFMWERDVGPNIRPGVWFSPFVVFDLDGDGRSEIAIKASEVATTLGGDGDINGDGITDYQETNGDVLWSSHPDVEYLEVWDGETGDTLARAPWIPVGPWGTDGYRYNRNMMSPAYLDGQQASVLITRGGNSRDEVHAYDYRNGALTRRWVWSVSNGGGNYGHNVRAGDIDGDGRDEFLFFNVAIDDDGSQVLWNTQEQHGDRFHMSDIDPDRPGMEIFYIQEFAASYTHPVSLRDAATGALIWGPTGDWADVGRGLCANIDARYRGMECWGVGSSPLYDAQGTDRGTRPNTPNMAIWWDADRERELISGTSITKWNGSSLQSQMSASGCSAGTRDIPMGYGDVLGDWREEAWWLCNSNSELRVYVSTAVADTRMYSFMQNPEYRIGVSEMTQGYVQAPHTSFYVGSDMSPPPAPRLAIPAGT